MFNTTKDSEWFCTYDKHQNSKIIGLCLFPECEQKRTTCLQCELEFHRFHAEQLIDVDDLQIWRKEWQNNHEKRLEKIQSFITQLDSLKKQLTDLIFNQIRIFQEFSDGFDSDIKTTDFSNLLDSAIAIKKVGSDDQMFDQQYLKNLNEQLRQENLLLSLYNVNLQFKQNVQVMQLYEIGLKLIQKKNYVEGIKALDQAKKINNQIFRSEAYLQLKTFLCCNFNGQINLVQETIDELESLNALDQNNIMAQLQLSNKAKYIGMLLIKSKQLEKAVDNIQWVVKILKQQNVDAFIIAQKYLKLTKSLKGKNEEHFHSCTTKECCECIYFSINKPYSPNRFDIEALDAEQIRLILQCLKHMCDDIEKNQKHDLKVLYLKVPILKMLGDYDTALKELGNVKDIRDEDYFTNERKSILTLAENDKNIQNILAQLMFTIIPMNEQKKQENVQQQVQKRKRRRKN